MPSPDVAVISPNLIDTGLVGALHLHRAGRSVASHMAERMRAEMGPDESPAAVPIAILVGEAIEPNSRVLYHPQTNAGHSRPAGCR